jgi:hypothetical protein
MPSRPDIRELAANVKEAFAEMDKETLLEILTFVVKEYVVEGPPPMLVHQAETLSDLSGASFARLITAMQTRFDHAELAMFVVDGEQVSVRVGGVMQPLLASRTPMAAPAAAELPRPARPAAGVRVVETGLQQRPQPPAPSGFVDTRQPAAPAPQAGSAPPPSRGLSVRGAPPSGGAAPPAAPAQGAAQPPAQGQPAPGQGQPPAAAQPEKPEGASGDDASARFSLLELD